MSEQATIDPPAEAATEMPAATTVVEEGGPTNFKEAADKFFAENDKADTETPPEASLEEVESLLNPPKKKKEEGQSEEGATPEQKQEEPEIEAPDFGFEGEKKAEEQSKEEFDTEAFDKETEQQVEGLDPKAQDGWKKLRAQLKEAKQAAQRSTEDSERVAALEKQAAEVEELRNRVEELTQSDYVLKVQNSTEYRDKVNAPVAEINRVVEQVANAFDDISQDKIMAAIREPDIVQRGRLLEALAVNEDGENRMPGIVLGELQRASGIYHQVQADHERMLSNAETEWKSVQEKQEKEALRAAEERRSSIRQTIDDIVDRASSILPAEEIAAAKREAYGVDISEETAYNQGYSVTAGALFPRVVKELIKAKEQIRKLGGEAAQKRAASPNLSEGAKTEEDIADKSPKTFAEAMARMPDNIPL